MDTSVGADTDGLGTEGAGCVEGEIVCREGRDWLRVSLPN